LCYVNAMRVEWDGKVYDFETPMIVSNLLGKFSLNREAYLVIVNNKLVTEDFKIGREDHVKLIRVVSGG